MSRLILVICVISGVLSSAWTAEQDVHSEVVTVTAPDFARTRERFASSVYAMIWQHPLLAKARAGLERESAEAEAKGRPSPLKVCAALSQAHFAFLGLSAEKMNPKMRLQFDIGDYAESMWQYIAEKGEAVPAPAGADAAFLKDGGKERAARFASTIVLSTLADPVKVEVAPSQHDFEAHARLNDVFEIIGTLPDVDKTALENARKSLKSELMQASVQIKENGILEHFFMDYSGEPIPGVVDLSIFEALPKECLLVGAMHSSGAFMKQQIQEAGVEADPAIRQIDMLLQGFGTSYVDLIGGINGTVAFAVTPAAPFPALSVFLPRSPEVDALLSGLLAQINLPVPADGTPMALPIPNMPILVQLGKNDSHWILSSDAMHMQGLLNKTAATFAEGPLSAVMKQQAGAGCSVIGAYDTQKIIALVMQYLAFIPDPEIKMQLSDLLLNIQQRVEPGYMVLNQVDKGFTYRAEGLFGGYFSVVPIIAAIAIPNLLESRVTANQSAAMATMRSAIFASQVQFQAGAYNDSDANGVGRYGFINELSGNVAVAGAEAGDIRLLVGPLAQPNEPAQAVGYYFKVYLPHGKGRAFKNAKQIRNAQLNDEGDMEMRFIVYAWPISSETGRQIFAMTQDGQIVVPEEPYNYEYDAVNMPPWNLIWGAEGRWGDKLKGWKYYSR